MLKWMIVRTKKDKIMNEYILSKITGAYRGKHKGSSPKMVDITMETDNYISRN